MSEDLSRAAVRWRCRRGMLELDRMLEKFVDQCYDRLDAAGKRDFARLLAAEDDRLWDWLSGRDEPDSQGMSQLVGQIRNLR